MIYKAATSKYDDEKQVMMTKNEYRLMFFHSQYNQQCITTKLAIYDSLRQKYKEQKINFMEVDCDVDEKLKKQYRVTGIPTLLIFADEALVGRYLGEISRIEFETIIENILQQKQGESYV